jgi:hypothetical protein
MTTVGLPDTSNYRRIEPISCLVVASACAYGSEGLGFESLRARTFGRAQLGGALPPFGDTPVAATAATSDPAPRRWPAPRTRVPTSPPGTGD